MGRLSRNRRAVRSVLMILYYFPPLGGIGTLRSLGHVRHLPLFGWQPRVLTVGDGAASDVRDAELLKKIPESVRIARTQFFDISRIGHWCQRLPFRTVAEGVSQFWTGFPPDRLVGWFPFAYREARQIIAREQVDAIYTLSGPYSAHVIGYFLKRATGLPWVADFGDEWTNNPFRRLNWSCQRKLDRWLEERVLETADHVVTAWPGMVELLSPTIRERATTITCSYDRDDFEGRKVPRQDRNRFRIVYVGSFYGEQQPAPLLCALSRLLRQGAISTNQIEFVCVGRIRMADLPELEGPPLSEIVREVPFVSHREAVRYMVESDVLLLIVSAHRGKENIPGKTFEYIAANRPIIALVPPAGATADLIRKTRTGIVVDPEDLGATESAIMDMYGAWRRGDLQMQPDWEHIGQYEARRQAGKLGEIMDRLIVGNHCLSQYSNRPGGQ